MFVEGTGFRKIILCTRRVDMRRGIDGLAACAMLHYHLDPTEKGVLYLFICFEGIGTVLYTLRLAPGNSFRFPKDQAAAMALSPEQYHELMSGIALEGTIREVYPHIDQPSDQSG